MPNFIEDGAPNGGDGNGDGIPDSTQPNVASLPSATGQGYITLVVPPGQDGCPTPQLSGVQALLEQALGGDPAFMYPFGLVRFTLNCPGPATVVVILHGGPSFGRPLSIYRKFGHMAPNFSGPQIFYTLPSGAPNHVTFGSTSIGGNPVITVSFVLQDGLLGDDGPAGDNRIVDPSGPGIAVPNGVPAASTWGLAGLVMLLAAVGSLGLWKIRARVPATK